MQLKYSYWYYPKAINDNLCDRIIELGETRLKELRDNGESTEALTFGEQEKGAKQNAVPLNDKPVGEFENNTETYVRDSEVTWIDEHWVYDLVVPLINQANKDSGWNWSIDAYEPMQFTKYNNSGFYGWHKDGGSDSHAALKRYIHGVTDAPLNRMGDPPMGYTRSSNFVGKVRKISMTLNLTDPNSYQGGDLKFDFGPHVPSDSRLRVVEEAKPRGSAIIFPSFIDHCVTPVVQGTRYSLVLWANGEPWK
jgi:PKHD-type hydroxylase